MEHPPASSSEESFADIFGSLLDGVPSAEQRREMWNIFNRAKNLAEIDVDGQVLRVVSEEEEVSYEELVQQFEDCITRCPALIEVEDSVVGDTPLLAAARFGFLEFVDILLKRGAKVNCMNSNFDTPLTVAVVKDNLEIVHLLLENGADPDLFTPIGKRSSPLQLTAEHGLLDIAIELLDHGASIDLEKTCEITALFVASSSGKPELVSLFLERGAQVNKLNAEGINALFIAAETGQTECCQILLEHGATTDIIAKDGTNMLVMATANGHLEAVKLLLDHGMDVNFATGDLNDTAIMDACSGGFLDLAKLLVSRGADPGWINNKKDTPLILAAQNGRETVVQWLVEECHVDPDPISHDGATPLFVASHFGFTEIMKTLLATNKVDQDRLTEEGVNCLFIACEYGHLDAAKLLWDYPGKKDVNIVAKDGSTMLHMASFNGHTAVVEWLLDVAKADPNLGGRTRLPTPLAAAIWPGGLEIIPLLLKAGASLEVPPECPSLIEIATTISSAKNMNAALELLLEAGAKLREGDLKPVQYALQKKRSKTTDKLLSQLVKQNCMNLATTLCLGLTDRSGADSPLTTISVHVLQSICKYLVRLEKEECIKRALEYKPEEPPAELERREGATESLEGTDENDESQEESDEAT